MQSLKSIRRKIPCRTISPAKEEKRSRPAEIVEKAVQKSTTTTTGGTSVVLTNAIDA